MANNPLLQLKPDEISLLRFGDSYVEYRLGADTFKLTFPSREAMDVAVEEWLVQARERGEFFRLEIVKTILTAWRKSRKPFH